MKVVVSVGTRPEFIKVAPVIMELKKRGIDTFFLYTGQHRDLCKPLFEFFNIYPDRDLAIMRPNQSLSHITSAILSSIDAVLDELDPDIMLVHGDTSTTLASSLAAFYKKIPVGHIEAGLRSGYKYAPFPEEMNRSLTGRIASYNFAPTETNRQNLLSEGVNDDAILVTGNTVIDSVTYVASKVNIEKKKQVLITAHRRENFGEPMKNIVCAISELAEKFHDYTFLFPVHPNPNVRKIVYIGLENIENVVLTEPMDYINFIEAMAASEIVLSDSGGVQEEAPTFDIPVVVMRRETERQEGVDAGTLILAGTEHEDIVGYVTMLLTDPAYYSKIASAVNPYGDGTAAAKIVDYIQKIK